MIQFFLAICALIARMKGWRFEGGIPDNIRKCVVIVAPHTSAWDFIIGMAALHYYRFNICYFGKEELFKFPLKKILLNTGGIPVDRFHRHNLVRDTVTLFNRSDQMYLVLAPEGTRAYIKKWRTGFYQIALEANVPVLFGFLDFGKKLAGISAPYYLTGNKENDFQKIRNYYKNVTPYNPTKWEPDFE